MFLLVPYASILITQYTDIVIVKKKNWILREGSISVNRRE